MAECDHRWLEERIAALDQLTRERFDGLNTRLRAASEAVVLQAKEYERRLDDLNGEHERIAQAVAANVSSDTWEAFKATYDTWKAGVDADLNEGRGKARGISAALGAVLGIAAVVVPAITALVIVLLAK